jgi:glutathione synthase/RimK-type ligase-like ATP-grasp enzyme
MEKTKRVTAMLNNPYEGELGGFGMKTYKERAVLATASGVVFVDLPITEETLSAIRRGSDLVIRYWSGSGFQYISMPKQRISVIYDYSGSGSSGSCDIGLKSEIIRELANAKKRFINGPEVESVCDNKSKSKTIFDNAGVHTPDTVPYTLDNAQKMFSGAKGLIFIKDPYASEGKGQFTIYSGDHAVYVASGTFTSRFNTLNGALTYISASVNDSYLVQEGVRMRKIDGSVFDIRALFQSDGHGNIVMPAVYMRLGAKGSYQSNMSAGGHAADPNLAYPGFETIKAQIAVEGVKVFRELQRSAGDVGEIGMDFLVSEEGRIFILEINALPGTKGIRDLAGETKQTDVGQSWKSALSDVLRNPIRYSKYIMNQQ